jgi:hypothetical protein
VVHRGRGLASARGGRHRRRHLVVPLVSAQLVEAFGWRRSFEILAAGALVSAASRRS